LTKEDLMLHGGDSITKQAFPDFLVINDVKLTIHYHFEPGHEHDGVTVDIPVALLNQLPFHPFTWLVPGLLEEKIIALLRSLPKSLRKLFVPVPDVAREALIELENLQKSSLYEILATYCHRRSGVPLSADLWGLETLPTHLSMNFRLLDNQQQILDNSRDLPFLQQKWGHYATQTCQREIAQFSGLERDNITTWDFDKLPEKVSLEINGITVQGFPTLVDQNTHVALRILDNQDRANHALRVGLHRLFWLALPIKNLLKQLPIGHKLCLQYVKLGNSEELKNDILTAVVETLFLNDPLPTQKSEFSQRLITGTPRIITVASEYAARTVDILAEYLAIKQQLNAVSTSENHVLADVKQQLEYLVYPGFIKEIPFSQLKHVPRYLKAVSLRLEKFQRDPNKDFSKAEQVTPFWQAYLQRRSQQNADNSKKLHEFRWMLEELRVSLFAQELKTAYPVSVQKLQKMWENI